jgi:hypothetical protein
MPTTFYPALNSVVSLDLLPEELSFVKDGVDDLLAKVYFKDLQYTVSARRDAAFYRLSIVSTKRIEFRIPGTGFALVLNPSHTDPSAISEFPITVDWEWPILGYIHRFRTEGFSFDGGAFYDIATEIFNLPPNRLVEEAFEVFYPGPVANAATSFVNAVNAHPSYAGMLPQPTSSDPATETANNISSLLSTTPARVIFEVFVMDQGNDSVTLDRVGLLFARVLGENVLDFLLKIITPKVRASLQVSAGIEFPREMLVPLLSNGEADPDTNHKSMLVFTTSGASLTFSTDAGFGYSDELEATLTPSQIGNTGLKISIEKAKLDLSKTKNIAEADADGRPVDFVGVYITKATISLPNFLNHDSAGSTAEIFAERLLVGTGGLSGQIGMRAKTTTPNTTPALIKASLGGGFEIGLSSFDLTFLQNSVTGSNINGYLKLPIFKDAEGNAALINIAIHIDANGDFNVVASEEQGIRALRLEGILDVIVKTVFVGRKDGRFFIGVSGALDFAAQGAPLGQFIPDKIEIQKLVIWDDGKFEFEGGRIVLPRALSLKVGPVKLSITALGFGSHEQEHNGQLRQYSYFTFDGGVSVNPGGVDVQGNGVAFYFTNDNDATHPLHVFMRIQSIAVDIIIPGNATSQTAAAIIRGFLSMQQPTPPATGTEYAGGISLSLPKLRLAANAAMRLNPSVPAFIIDVGLELPVPILLGSTGLGIYGFRGLLGVRYVASRQHIGLADTDPWWMYYKKKVAPDNREGIQISKFAQREGFSLGAGVSLATSPDGGRTFSSKIFFLLSLPEVFLLQGQGQILRERIGLNTTQDPPFFAMIAISSTSVETAFGVNYKIPDEGSSQGKIATVDGVLEMGFFWGNSASWYVNIGKDTPENRRIQVRLLTLFDVYFYLMLSASGIRTGAGASYSLKKQWGPLKAELSAYLDVAARMSFRPKQVGGSIQVGGTVELSIFGIGFGLSGDASLVAEAVRPFMIGGSLKVCVKVLWKRYCGKFEFNWTFDSNLNWEELPVMKPNLSEAGKAMNMHTGELFPLWTGTSLPSVPDLTPFMVPMDSYIDLEMMKPVKVGPAVSARFGGSTQGSKFVEFFPPQKGKSDRVRHEYEIENVEILYHNGVSWVPYDVYAAATPLQLAPFITTPLNNLPYGYWQEQTPQEYTKLRILATSPLNYLSQGTGDVVPEELGITVETIFCAPEKIEKICAMMDDWRPFDSTPINLTRNQFYFNQLYRFRVTGGDGKVITRPAASLKNAVQAEANEAVELYFTEGFPVITLHMAVCTDTADISYYERKLAPLPHDYNDQPVYIYRLIKTVTMPRTQGLKEVNYEDLSRPVDKIVIRTGNCKPRDPKQCEPTSEPYLKLLFVFLQTLIENKHLAGPELGLAESYADIYRGVFFETELYPKQNYPNTRYTVTARTYSRLYVEITDDEGFHCFIELEVAPEIGGINWDQVVGIRDFNSVPGSGDPTLFAAELVVIINDKKTTVPVTGHSCYQLLNCPREGSGTAGINGVRDFLNALAAKNRLVQPLVNLDDNETELFALLRQSSVELEQGVKLTDGKMISGYDAGSSEMMNMLVFDGPDLNTGTQISLQVQGRQNLVNMELIRSFQNFRLEREEKGEVIISADAVLKPTATATIVRVPIDIRIRDFRPDGANPAPTQPVDTENKECMGCSATLNRTADDLQTYLNTLLIHQHLFISPDHVIELFPKLNDIYDGVFQGTSLYDQYPVPEGTRILHQVDAIDNGIVRFHAFDNHGFKCAMHLQLLSIPKEMKIEHLQRLENIQLDPAADASQPVFDFVADAIFYDGRNTARGRVKGRSCKPLNVCGDRCEVLFYGACVLRYEDAVINDTMGTQEQVTTEVQNMVNAFNGSLQPIWRPYTNYAVRVTTWDRRYRETGGSVEHQNQRTHIFGFRTTGPVGHFHEYFGPGGVQTERPDYTALKLKDRQDEFKLKTLLHYIDFSKSYPNADGQLLNAKPLFYRAPKLYLYFTKSYVYEMLRSWGDFSSLDGSDISFKVTIKDPAPDPTQPPLSATELTWDLSPLPIINTEVQVINNMITYGFPCANVTVIDPLWVVPSAQLPDLRPLKLYSAIFNSGFKFNNAPASAEVIREVLRYGFQTSRYPDFDAQVNSWKLKVTGAVIERAAVFTLPVETYAGMDTLATQLLDGTMPADHLLQRDFGDSFNRLVDGIFRLKNLQVAVTTEFNAVKDELGRIYGLLIRNPEPFNDPKMPAAEIATTLTATINGSTAWKVIWSTDRSQAFVTNSNNTLNIPAGSTGVFTFVYKQWNGSAYAAVSTVVTPNIQLP